MAHKTKLQSPIALKWTIPEARLHELKDSIDGSLCSKRFNVSNIPDVQYFLVIYPNGSKEDRRGQTWITLYLKCSDNIKIEAEFCIKVVSANFEISSKHIFDKSFGRGGKCCTTAELFDPEKGFIVDGKLTIEMDGIFMTEKEEADETWCPTGDPLCLTLWENQNKDFVIVVENKEITAHKLILAARSPVFTKMFESGLKEAKENKVKIEDFSFNIVEKAIKLCYHHGLVPNTTLEEKMQLLQFFNKYDIQLVKNDLESYMITVIDESNVCQLANCSLLTNALKLEKKCYEFLQGCLKNPKPISDFDLLDKDFGMNLLKGYFCHVSS